VSRAAVAFPGRGAYGPSSLRSLPAGHPWVRRADELRDEAGLPKLSAIDAAERFDAPVHLRPTNSWPLVFLCSLLDAERIADDHEVVVVVASSTGWYTALAASGVLGFDDAFRLVGEMAAAAEAPLPDAAEPAEIVYPLTDEAWQPVPARISGLRDALDSGNGSTALAVDLGAFAVLGGTTKGIDALAGRLPAVTVADRSFPLRGAAAHAWHTPLRARAVDEAIERLGALALDRPNVTLVDGRGARFTPWSTDPDALAEQSLREQGTSPYDFASAFRVALREYATDVVLLPGPGSSLGAPCAQIIVTEGYRGLRSRAEFEAAQTGPSPLLLSMRR
jgi:[acyl-carrier-protein] S-malonyltransferase